MGILTSTAGTALTIATTVIVGIILNQILPPLRRQRELTSLKNEIDIVRFLSEANHDKKYMEQIRNRYDAVSTGDAKRLRAWLLWPGDAAVGVLYGLTSYFQDELSASRPNLLLLLVVVIHIWLVYRAVSFMFKPYTRPIRDFFIIFLPLAVTFAFMMGTVEVMAIVDAEGSGILEPNSVADPDGETITGTD